MMLRELNELGTHFDLSPVGYSNAIAHWQIDLAIDSVCLLETENVGSKPKPGKSLLLPDLRRNADEPLLIDDGGEYVFGVGSRGANRQKLYLELLDRCIAETDNAIAFQVRKYIDSCDVQALDRRLSEQIPPKKKRDGGLEEREPFWWARDRFIFTFEGEFVTQHPVIQQWWSKYYASKQDVEPGTCLLTGEETLIVKRKMPMMVKGVPGASSSGAALTSFDKAAYQSHGWEGSSNAAIGFESAVRLHKSLDILLRTPQNHYRLGDEVFVFWGEKLGEGINPEFWTDPAEIASTIFAIPNTPSNLLDEDEMPQRFYLAVLKGNRGRIALSSWNELLRDRIKSSIQQFVECQQLVNLRAKPIWVLLNIAFRDPSKEHTDKIATALMQAALLGKPLPDEYAIRVCDRACAEQDVFKSSDRIQALAFYLVSNNLSIMEILNLPTEERPTTEQVAYILGRIAFLMHIAQVRAQGLEREETNVSRALRTLSTTPVLMFPRLYYGCIAHHLVDRDGKNLGYIRNCLDQEFACFGSGFNPAQDLPELLDAKAQSCFFLGWGIRRSEFFSKKEKEDK